MIKRMFVARECFFCRHGEAAHFRSEHCAWARPGLKARGDADHGPVIRNNRSI